MAAWLNYRRKKRDSVPKNALKSKNNKGSGRVCKSVSYENSRPNSEKSLASSGRVRTERSVLLESISYKDDLNNLPAEELLELGLYFIISSRMNILVF